MAENGEKNKKVGENRNGETAGCGFACLLAMAVWMLFLLSKKDYIGLFKTGIATCLLTITYLATNLTLVSQLLGQSSYISHKTEIILEGTDVLSELRILLLRGEDYVECFPLFFLPLIVPALMLTMIRLCKKQSIDKSFLLGLGVILLIFVWVCVYNSPLTAELRNRSTGVFHDFNLGRVSWLLPTAWYVVTLKALHICWDWMRTVMRKEYCQTGVWCVLSCLLIALFCHNLFVSDVKPNVMKILKGGDYYMLTWKQFFASDLFDECEKVIDRPKEEYKVVSLGIYPSAAAYNGFNCLDAYSNNYDLQYKHEFRKVIAPELAKAPYLTSWFDSWGNRCYLVLAESNNYFTFEKRWSPASYNVDLDFDQLRKMGCEYLISASYLVEGEELGITLLNEEPIMTEDSWYRLWVYKL